ncbi:MULTISPECIES: DUF5818 domain-containing protein [unclassified Sphingomonas]|uniref:DUF5818 domain-containing protein n=1 Tax=unclassified Sphingomonas TaxID=196159 RepID=UPI0007019FA3|nr:MULTISPECIES: DUF5818 domain-containing protein [unclassified Sphingomonas]KQX19380.1 hypothetical protein ASD17_12630 [Sphingomonas sp. Root1294]KQY65583.1 hypothetical protein ASD39_15830 [Sphingomonas sp. Root50]KRB95116.1 hypothetical protein ASE22_04225 [Sphingomonas sp. Root720]
MQDRRQFRQTGRLIARNHCFALRCEDGGEYRLEMDPVPQHLLGQQVRIEGRIYGSSLIAVEGIGPA